MLDYVNDCRPSDACVVRTLAYGDEARWDGFVAAATGATFFHRSAWRSVIESLGHQTHYLYAERDGVVTGVLPLAEIKSWLFGHALISTPFCVYGGVAASDPGSRARLVDAATALADRLRVDYLELRNREPDTGGWPVKDLYVRFHKPLQADPDKNWKAISGKRRNKIRKGMKAGLEARHDGSVEEFYRVYAESVRNLGTPVLPRRYYATLKQAFDKDWEITIVRHLGQPVATVMSLYFRDHVHSYYAGSVARARGLAANDFMYWALMQRATERGARTFDFGRSKQHTGSGDFKEQWGFQSEPLPYAYHLVRAREVPNISPVNPKYRMFINAWKKLPLPVSCAVGPWLARDLG